MVVEKILSAVDHYFKFNYIEPLPKNTIPPDKRELDEKIKKKLIDTGIFDHAKQYQTTSVPEMVPALIKLFIEVIQDEDFLVHNLDNLKSLAEDETLLSL